VALVEILVTPGCPYERAAITRVELAAQILDVWPELRLIMIKDLDEARRFGFFGSPTIRVDGEDIACVPNAESASVRCRLYETTHGLDWVPDVRPIYLALERAMRRAPHSQRTRSA
jgi:hypothetical protein